jgi:hypothetical protein
MMSLTSSGMKYNKTLTIENTNEYKLVKPKGTVKFKPELWAYITKDTNFIINPEPYMTETMQDFTITFSGKKVGKVITFQGLSIKVK